MVAMGSWRTNRKGASPFLAALLLLCLVPAIASGQIRQRTVPDTKPAHLGTQGNQEAEVDTRTDVVYVDCFTEPAHSTLHVLDVQLRDVTRAMFRSPAEQKPPTCARACWIAGYPYVGVKGYYQCWCGKEVKLRLFPRGRCMACLGSFQYRCGMTDSIAIYKVNQGELARLSSNHWLAVHIPASIPCISQSILTLHGTHQDMNTHKMEVWKGGHYTLGSIGQD
eukprot:scpid31967/ scgid4174/ 